ncbi:hypothetical protein NTG1052_300096 [Candidatus Nitrotoga sp. 1052]|nr:hypothetical protein NTG1052_300096 [Candidatus Nitrotoga sp. 1052]
MQREAHKAGFSRRLAKDKHIRACHQAKREMLGFITFSSTYYTDDSQTQDAYRRVRSRTRGWASVPAR